MYLREVLLKNWRSYQRARFTFPLPTGPTGRKKVTLIGAMNGTGKTSLLAALYLGLFGREAMYYVEGVKFSDLDEEKQRSYRMLMERILHRSALNEEDPQVSVQIVFDIGEEAPLIVTRTWHFRRGGRIRDISSSEGEEILIQYQNKPRRYSSWQEANNRIEDLLFPAYVIPCFFFDGEQAQKRVEGAGSVALSDAMQTLYGTKLLSGLSDTLRAYTGLKKQLIRREVGEVKDDELAAKRASFDSIEQSLRELKLNLASVRADLQIAEAARKNKQEELLQISGNSSIDIQLAAEQRSVLEKAERDLQEEINRNVSALALPIALRKYGPLVLDRLKSEIIRDRWLILRDETSNKIEGIIEKTVPAAGSEELSPPLTEEQRISLSQRLRSSIESIWSPPPDGCADQYRYLFLGASDRQATLTRVERLLTARSSNVVEQVQVWQNIKGDLAEAQRRWESVRDIQPRLREVRDRLSELNEKVSELNGKKTQLEIREVGYTDELNELKAAIAQMEGLKQRRGPEEDRIDLAERAREVLRDVEGKLRPLCVSSLEECCTKHFREMISVEYRSHKVQFDQDDQPMLVGENSEIIYITTLSGAQKRAFGLAFTLAIAEVSGQDAPIVIDTPVGSMDSEFRKRVLKYLAKVAPAQLIFLSHDEEIYGDYVKEIEPYIAKKYLVGFRPLREGTGVSSVEEGSYFSERMSA